MDVSLKVDIEGHELDALPQWIESGALEKVFSRVKIFSSSLFPASFRWTRWLLSFTWGEYTDKRSKITMETFIYSRWDRQTLNHLEILLRASKTIDDFENIF